MAHDPIRGHEAWTKLKRVLAENYEKYASQGPGPGEHKAQAVLEIVAVVNQLEETYR